MPVLAETVHHDDPDHLEEHHNREENHEDGKHRDDDPEPNMKETFESHPDEQENSPIDLVAAAVPITDDPTLPTMTFRLWVIGFFFTILGASISQYNFYRTNAIAYSIFFVNLVSFPLGNFMARVLPTHQFNTFGFKWSFNPGPFNIKEHMLIGIMASAGGTSAYATDIVTIQKVFFNQNIGIWGALALIISSQCLGYGMAGFLRKYLVKPASMFWPGVLPSVVFYNTLHGNYADDRSNKKTDDEKAEGISKFGDGSGSSRMKIFWIAFVAIFVWQIFPGFIFPLVTSITWLCWINPDSRDFWAYFSGRYGSGIFSFSLDWNSIGGATLYVPWWAQANQYFGAILQYWFILPIIWATNTLNAQNYRMVSSHLYTVGGSRYNVNYVMDPDTKILNETRYEEYGPLRMSPGYVLNFGYSFVALSASMVHVGLFYGKEILTKWRVSRQEDEDIHTRMMRVYPEVPQWWYISLFVVMLALAIVTVELLPIYLPWYGLLLAIAIAVVTVLPLGVIMAISNSLPGLNVITELVCGFIWPGRPIANVCFKTMGYMAMYQCIILVQDLKLGHYMKVPPRSMFTVQLIGTLIGAVVNYAVLELVIRAKFDYISGDAIDPTGTIDGRQPNIFYASAILFGGIGPLRMFGSTYSFMYYGFLLGVLLPVPFWLLHKKYPSANWNLVNIPIIAAGMSQAPQIPTNTIATSLAIGFYFTFYLYRYHKQWWSRYAYILSAALDSGTQVCGLFLFVLVGGLYQVTMPQWWGNSDNLERCGSQETLLKY